MEIYVIWLLASIGLIIAELASGTFYLFFLGIAAGGAAIAAYFGFAFWLQALLAALIAGLGMLWVRRRRRASDQSAMPPLDVGQPVVWEAWIDRNDSLARVRYRGAGWDARVSADTAGEVGEVLYIVDVEGSLLHVAKRQPG